jgi:hypothetical protein
MCWDSISVCFQSIPPGARKLYSRTYFTAHNHISRFNIVNNKVSMITRSNFSVTEYNRHATNIGGGKAPRIFDLRSSWVISLTLRPSYSRRERPQHVFLTLEVVEWLAWLCGRLIPGVRDLSTRWVKGCLGWRAVWNASKVGSIGVMIIIQYRSSCSWLLLLIKSHTLVTLMCC